MPTIIEEGYLEGGYLEDEYLGGKIQHGEGFQVNMIIKDKLDPKGMQAQMLIKPTVETGMQAAMQIVDKQDPVGMQAAMQIVDKQDPVGMQAQMVINNQVEVGMQSQMFIKPTVLTGMQASMDIGDIENPVGFQAQMFLDDQSGALGMQAKMDSLRHALHEVYLEGGYLEDPYLATFMCAFLGMQANMNVIETVETGMQANMQIVDKLNPIGMQSEMHIVAQENIGMQADMLRVEGVGFQSSMIIYNNTEFRILCSFPSRGTPAQLGINWTASSTETGDFSANNLNTDIEEQVYRSTTAALVTLECDTGLTQGVPIDTIALRNHNLTKSAIVTVQGAKNAGFAPVDITFTMTTELTNMYFIAASFPTLLGQNRYWRFTIQDPTNPNGFIEIGTILFGASSIFNTNDGFDNPIIQGFRHFRDSNEVEAFTSITNDRALKKFLRLSFSDMDFFKANFSKIEEAFLFARTSLKCLVIPTPVIASRFAVFAKLIQMPELSHNSIENRTDPTKSQELIAFDLEWDESL